MVWVPADWVKVPVSGIADKLVTANLESAGGTF